jgi:hypothetical protein
MSGRPGTNGNEPAGKSGSGRVLGDSSAVRARPFGASRPPAHRPMIGERTAAILKEREACKSWGCSNGISTLVDRSRRRPRGDWIYRARIPPKQGRRDQSWADGNRGKFETRRARLERHHPSCLAMAPATRRSTAAICWRPNAIAVTASPGAALSLLAVKQRRELLCVRARQLNALIQVQPYSVAISADR